MSGIAGLLLAEHSRVARPEWLDRQSRALHMRGPDGQGSWSGGRVYLRHAHRHSTGFVESNFAAAETGIVGLADIRLDNRAELADLLGADERSASDIALVSLAYRHWGPDCCSRLLGDFAFALWDKGSQTLFCARDQWGVKPLFYAQSGGGFSFGSDPGALICDDDGVNEHRVASFIAGFVDDPAATALSQVRRLLPGHWLQLKDGELVTRRYWRAQAAPDAGLSPPEAVRDLLQQAVRARLRGAPAMGAMLSGGLDSSSVVATAARLRPGVSLRTLSFDYPATPELSERRYVDAVLAAYPLQPSFVPFDDLAPLQGVSQLALRDADLLFAPGSGKMLRLFKTAKELGATVLLDGHGGDEVISHGYGRLAELAQAGRWGALYGELRGVAATFNDSPSRVFLRYFAAYGPGRRLAGRAQRLWSALRPPETGAVGPTAFVAADLAKRICLADRHAEWRQALRTAHADEDSLHRWNVSSPAVGQSFEALDRAAALAGVELRFPFFDRRLVCYALSLPPSEILRDGWSRSVLRRAMQDILPPQVQWRRDKTDFSSELRLGLVKHHGGELDALDGDSFGVSLFLNMDQVRSTIARLRADPLRLDAGELFGLWRALFLSLWLQSRAATS
ncbi:MULTISPECIES: asparagine synthase-related protein [unclassified Devosia]|uniref:asparagine synthase-related protein n=1 Tax=unclassified Devosia TaxID=196773 RepID=UPI001556732E|nr:MULTISPECIES: asparagine synthase-related protein [unclassified Devosia]